MSKEGYKPLSGIDKTDTDGNLHVMPADGCDYFNHIESERCQCRPKWTNKNDYLSGEAKVKVISHNFMREEGTH